MKFALGLYTQISQGTPQEVCMRTLACILKPLLTHVYNRRECRLSIVPGNALTEFLSWRFPEINLLLSSLAKSGSLELVTSSYNNAVLPLMPHKDRSAIVDKTTTILRKTYGVRATSLWCYGQIWSPSIIAMMKTIGLERLVISSYDALTQKSGESPGFRMNELGRRIDVIQSSDRFSRLVSSYAQNEISLDSLIQSMTGVISSHAGDDDLVCMINLDQLCQGASYNREDDEQLSSLFTRLFDAAQEKGFSLSLMRDLTVRRVGYLPSGWYGRDACSGSLNSFNELFVRSGSFRFLLGRYLALNAFVADARKDRVLRRRLQDMISSLPSGNLFLCDTHASCLSVHEHRQFYRTVIEAEKMLQENGLTLDSVDVDDDGLEEEFCYGRQNNALFSRVGGSVYEYSSKQLLVNVFDAIPPWLKSFPEKDGRRSFIDYYELGGVAYDLSSRVYDLESVNRSRNEFYFTLDDEDLPFSVTKHYRLANQNLYLSHTIVNTGDSLLKGTYVTSVYFCLPGATAFAYDERKTPLVGASLSGIKNVRFNDSSRLVQLSFTSTDYFSVEEDNRFQSEVTTLGSQQFYLYTRVRLRFSLDLAPMSAQSLNIVTRISSTKEK